MINAIRPLLNEQVEHALDPARDLFGKVYPRQGTTHLARVNLTPGRLFSPASGERMTDAAATIWLLDHPREIKVGDIFTLPDGQALKAARVERRKVSDGTIHKVFLT